LILGILGVICWGLAPFAWWLGRKELKAIKSGTKPATSKGQARAGFILGIIGTVTMVVAIPVIAMVAIRVAGERSQRDPDGSIVETGTMLLDDVRPGDCGDMPSSELFLSVTVHPCAVAHDFEIYALVTLPDGPKAAFPGLPTVTATAEQECHGRFAAYVGESFEDALDLSFLYFHPTEDSWEFGDRLIICALASADEGGTLVGSHRAASG
jgi:hypothetical protein